MLESIEPVRQIIHVNEDSATPVYPEITLSFGAALTVEIRGVGSPPQAETRYPSITGISFFDPAGPAQPLCTASFEQPAPFGIQWSWFGLRSVPGGEDLAGSPLESLTYKLQVEGTIFDLGDGQTRAWQSEFLLHLTQGGMWQASGDVDWSNQAFAIQVTIQDNKVVAQAPPGEIVLCEAEAICLYVSGTPGEGTLFPGFTHAEISNADEEIVATLSFSGPLPPGLAMPAWALKNNGLHLGAAPETFDLTLGGTTQISTDSSSSDWSVDPELILQTTA